MTNEIEQLGQHFNGFPERLVNMEKAVALIELRLESLEKGTHLTSILNDLTEIKEMLKGSTNFQGLVSKVDKIEDDQARMIWMMSGFALCIPTFAALVFFLFPKMYDIQFVPHSPATKSTVQWSKILTYYGSNQL